MTHKIENSFGVPSSCHTYIAITNDDDLKSCWTQGLFEHQHFIIGAGSNTIPPEFFNGIIFRSHMHHIAFETNAEGFTTVSADAGVVWDDLVHASIAHGLQGLENLSLIPGTVGAAPIQNIGAYGAEVSEHIASVECFNTRTGNIEILKRSECQFSYRNSIFKMRPELFIVRVNFILAPAPKKISTITVRAVLKAVVLSFGSLRIKGFPHLRLSAEFNKLRELLDLSIIPPRIKRRLVITVRRKTLHDPKLTGNSGCFFKCPIVSNSKLEQLKEIFPQIEFFQHEGQYYKISACSLIRGAGADKLEIGGVKCDSRRPVVLLNSSNAKSADVKIYASTIKSKVFKKFQIELEEEVIIL